MTDRQQLNIFHIMRGRDRKLKQQLTGTNNGHHFHNRSFSRSGHWQLPYSNSNLLAVVRIRQKGAELRSTHQSNQASDNEAEMNSRDLFALNLARWIILVASVVIAVRAGVAIDYQWHIAEESAAFWLVVIATALIFTITFFVINWLASVVTEIFYGVRL